MYGTSEVSFRAEMVSQSTISRKWTLVKSESISAGNIFRELTVKWSIVFDN